MTEPVDLSGLDFAVDMMRRPSPEQYEKAIAARDARIVELEGLLSQADQIGPWAIKVEKLLCAKLGREWVASGISIESLVDELSNTWPKLEAPAKVGGARFQPGVSTRLVVEAAQRQYEYDVTPEKEEERIARASSFVRQVWGKPDIDAMVSRFLSWHLPSDFNPDGGITFAPNPLPHTWPVGTNLFTADQAKAMFEYVLGDQVKSDDRP